MHHQSRPRKNRRALIQQWSEKGENKAFLRKSLPELRGIPYTHRRKKSKRAAEAAR
jgi:hypothetical protein